MAPHPTPVPPSLAGNLESSTNARSPYPLVRRVVTGTTQEGKSAVIADTPIEPYMPSATRPSRIGLFWTNSSPETNTVGVGPELELEDLTKLYSNSVGIPQGSHFYALDFPPKTSVGFHQTLSLDYGVVTKGNMTLLLDEGKVILGPGDVIVQRGVIHGWENEGDEWVRMYLTMTPAKKIELS